MLKTSLPSRARRAIGTSLLAMSVLLVGTAAWAAQPSPQAEPGLTSKAVPVRGITMTPPKYRKDAADQKIEDRVILIVDVAADGSVTKVVVERGAQNSNLDAAAVKAAETWKFIPEVKGGKAVASRVRVPVEFRMDGDPDAKKG